jgi:hypothetical protein
MMKRGFEMMSLKTAGVVGTGLRALLLSVNLRLKALRNLIFT